MILFLEFVFSTTTGGIFKQTSSFDFFVGLVGAGLIGRLGVGFGLVGLDSDDSDDPDDPDDPNEPDDTDDPEDSEESDDSDDSCVGVFVGSTILGLSGRLQFLI